MNRSADCLVVFGITGDLAHKMTFRSLYRLHKRGLLDIPVIGVAAEDWSADRLRARARESLQSCGEAIEEASFGEFAGRLSYVGGDFAQAETYERLTKALGQATHPTFYLEIPPSLF